MFSLSPCRDFIQRHYTLLIAGIIAAMTLYSLFYLTNKPIPWKDEATAIEGAYNFSLFCRLSVYLEPDVFVEYPFFAITSGPALTLPLAGIFSIFGFGLAQARAYMILWIIITLAAVAYIQKKLFGAAAGMATLLLFISFTTFHLYGRTMVGELPGFLFLFLGFYLIAERRSYWLGGLCAGISMIMRPSEYLLIAPAIAAYWLLARRHFIDLVKIGLAALPSILLFIAFEFPHPLSSATWKTALELYRNPFGEKLASHFVPNLAAFVTQPTLIYFLGLLACALLMIKSSRDAHAAPVSTRSFVTLSLVYIAFNIAYFLRSPGWFRYLFPTQLLLLAFAYPAIGAATERFRLAPFAGKAAIAGLLALQLGNFIFFPSIHASSNLEIMAAHLLAITPATEKIFIINDPLLSALIPPEHKYNLFIFTGIPTQGRNHLSRPADELPYIVIYRNYNADNRQFIEPYAATIARNYKAADNLGQKGYTVLQRAQ